LPKTIPEALKKYLGLWIVSLYQDKDDKRIKLWVPNRNTPA